MPGIKWYGVSQGSTAWFTGDINAKVAIMKKWGFNTARIGFGQADFEALANNAGIRQSLDALLNTLPANGIKAIISCFNYLDMVNYFGSLAWKTAWLKIVAAYKNDSRILAWELFNEPWGPTHTPNNWDLSITTAHQVLTTLDALANQIAALGDTHPCLYPQPWLINNEKPTASNAVVGWKSWEWHKYETDAEAIAFAQNYINGSVAWSNAGVKVAHTETGCYMLDISSGGAQSWLPQRAFLKEIINGCVANGMGFIIHNFFSVVQGVSYSDRYQAILAESNYKPTTPGQGIDWKVPAALGVATLAFLVMITRKR